MHFTKTFPHRKRASADPDPVLHTFFSTLYCLNFIFRRFSEHSLYYRLFSSILTISRDAHRKCFDDLFSNWNQNFGKTRAIYGTLDSKRLIIIASSLHYRQTTQKLHILTLSSIAFMQYIEFEIIFTNTSVSRTTKEVGRNQNLWQWE